MKITKNRYRIGFDINQIDFKSIRTIEDFPQYFEKAVNQMISHIVDDLHLSDIDIKCHCRIDNWHSFLIHIDVVKEDINPIFTHICKSDNDIYPSEFSIFARVIDDFGDGVLIERFQKFGSVPVGKITISKEDFNKYYKVINNEKI